MTTVTMRRQIYFVLVGALMFVTRETVCIAIHSDERRGVDSMESHELLEHDDFSLERVHVGTVFSPQTAAGQFVSTQTTNNGPTGQVNGVTNPNIRNPVLIHSDEYDTFSDEVSLAGILVANIRNAPSQVTAGGQEPIRGKRIFKQSDERYIVSARPGKQVIIRPGATPGNPIQTTSIHKAIYYRHSDEHDYSDEVGSILAPPSTRLVPTNNVDQLTNKPSAVYRLHSDEHDNIQVQDPVTKQVFNIKTELRDSVEHEVYFSDDVIRSQIGALPFSVNSNVKIPMIVNDGRLISQHSDEIYDTSYEVVSAVVNQQNGQNLTAPTQGVLISRHSDERDDSLEIVRGQIRPAGVLPVQTAVTGAVPLIRKHSDEVDDISLEIHGTIRPGQSPISVVTIKNQDVHLIQSHSNEYDDTSLEVQLIRNQSAPGQFHLLKHSDDHLLKDTGTNLNLQNGQITAHVRSIQTVIPGQHLIIRHSDEVGDVSLEVHHVISGVQPPNTVGRIVPAVATGIGHLSRHSDEQHDISLEDVIHRSPSQAVPVQRGVLDSYEHEDLSLEVDINLLPDIQRLFSNARTDVGVVFPKIQTPATVIKASAAEVNQENVVVQQRMSRLLKQNISQQLQDILVNPVFQQKIQEIDSRLKSASDSRSKRLIEKYAEALALSSSPSFNAASATINPSLYLSFLITWVLVWLL